MNDTVAPPRRLVRIDTDRKLGGVAAGIGAYFGIDPVIVRIAFVLATVFGGAGLLVYAVAWVIMPRDDGTTVLAELPHADARRSGAIVLIGLAALLVLGRSVWADELVLPLLLIGAGVVLLAKPRTGAAAPRAAFVGGDEPTAAAPPPPATTGIPSPPPAAPPSGFPTGWATIGVLAVVAGSLGLLAGAGAGIDLRWALLACTTVLGIGLLAGSVLGRARWLLAVAVPFFLALSVLTAADLPLSGGIGERLHQPRAVAEIDSVYELGIGELRLDLSAVPVEEFARSTQRIEVSLGLGDVTIIVPDGVTVVVDGHLAAGEATVFGRPVEGTDLDLSGRRTGAEGAGTLELDIDAGLAQITVR